MDTYGFERDLNRKERWEELLGQLEWLRDKFGEDTEGALGMCFAAMQVTLAALCKIARQHGQGMTSVMRYAPPTDANGTDARMSITLLGGGR